jgi:hypothetical protein
MLRQVEQVWRLRQRLSVQTYGLSGFKVSPRVNNADGIDLGGILKDRREIHSSIYPSQSDESTQDAGVKVCVVGSGPAGFYAVDRVRN